jgi:hypothetical protein
MKKIILILITILFTSNVYEHPTKGVTKDFDYNQNCTKKRSVLNYIAKHRLYRGDKGEIIKFNSYTAFGTPAAIGWGYADATSATECTGSSASTGLFGAEPSVIITFE